MLRSRTARDLDHPWQESLGRSIATDKSSLSLISRAPSDDRCSFEGGESRRRRAADWAGHRRMKWPPETRLILRHFTRTVVDRKTPWSQAQPGRAR